MLDYLYIFWDPEPSIFGLRFRWYGLLFAASFYFGYVLLARIFRKEKVPDKWLESLTIYMALGTILGARLGHCFFYDPGYYLAHPVEILKIWEGGLASHGAAIGIITALIIWSRRVSKRNVLWILDRIVIFVALSGLFIRTGNLWNSEILGKESKASWAFVFPQADQTESLKARWKGGKVELHYGPQPSSRGGEFVVMRSRDEGTYETLPNVFQIPPTNNQGEPAWQSMVDEAPGDDPSIRYVTVYASQRPDEVVPNADSADLRKAFLKSAFDPGGASFSARWEGDAVHLSLHLNAASVPGSRKTMLLRGDGSNQWELLHLGMLGRDNPEIALDTLDHPALGSQPHYWLAVKEDETLLIARHPTQIYEALAYFAIFIFLYWTYYRKNGKIPHGLFFGYFLILVFSARFLLEYLKEEQVDFLSGSPFNMGQLLSIPFVIAGVVIVYLASKYSDSNESSSE